MNKTSTPGAERDLYEDLTFLVSQLNNDAPKIQKLYKELKSNTEKQNHHMTQTAAELHELSEKTLQAITEERKSAEKLFQKYRSTAEQALQEAKDLKEQIDLFAGLLEKTGAMLLSVDTRFSEIEQKIKTLEQGMRPFPDESNLMAGTNGMVIDYNEVTTARVLYDKYYGKIGGPLIIKRTGWKSSKDYVFVVEGLTEEGEKVKGSLYSEGNFNSRYSYSANTRDFRVYNGPYAAKVAKNHLSGGYYAMPDDSGEVPF